MKINVVIVLLSVAILGVGCSSSPEPVQPPAREMPAPPPPAPKPKPTVVDPPKSAVVDPPEPAVVDPPEPAKPDPAPPKAVPEPVLEPEPELEPETVAPSPPPKPEPPPKVAPEPAVVDVGGHVEMAATKAGLTRIGVAKCKLCHKVQFASWAETAHATRTPPLDCEDCHGAGSEYKGLKVMRDPEAARAAGMVLPDRAFCVQCHLAWNDDLLTRSHAHKE